MDDRECVCVMLIRIALWSFCVKRQTRALCCSTHVETHIYDERGTGGGGKIITTMHIYGRVDIKRR